MPYNGSMTFRTPYQAAFAFLGLSVFLSSPVLAQDKTQDKTPAPVQENITPVPTPAPVVGRKRIGIALAGGSAFGESHIGVLKWLEEHHIPIDYVAGTSMGGLVGGAYACGYSPDELEDLLSSVDWQSALRGDTPYPALAFRRKEDVRAVPNRFELGLRKGLTLPIGLNPAHKIGLLLSEIAYSNSTVDSFDDLPIPFRCVATDLQTGEAVVMKNSSLAGALRATMALPGLFTPVERAGRLLSDGGIVNNLPTEAVRDMGAETIIAVDLNGFSLKNSKKVAMQDLLAIIGRSATLAVRANEQVSLKLANVVITPDLNDLTGNDFMKTDDFVKRGYAAAEAQKAALLPYALDDAAWQTYITARNARKRKAPDRLQFLTVAGPEYGTARRLNRQLQPLLHHPFPSKEADETFTLLTGGGRYNSVQYEATTNTAGLTGLRVIAQQKGYGPPYLRPGLEINGSDTKSVQVNAVARYVGLDAGLPGAEERVDVRLGSNIQVAGEYFLPIGRSESPLFVAPRVFYADNSRNVFQNGTRTAVYGTEEYGSALDLGVIPNRFFESRLGYQVSRFQSGVRTGTDLGNVRGNVESLRLGATWDLLDDGVIPHRGSRTTAQATRYLRTPSGRNTFSMAEVRYSQFIPTSVSTTVFGFVSGGTAFGTNAPEQLQFSLGGPFRLGGVGVEALRGNEYYLLTGGVMRQFSAPPPLGGRTLIGVWAEVGGTFKATYAGADNGTRVAISTGVISETFLGPILIGLSAGNNGRGGIRTLPYFVLGRIF